MKTKSALDPETKVELLIKLAFGLSLDSLMQEYKLSKNTIINLRKNNYKLYNKFFDHWKILEEVAILGLSPKCERAVNVVKKFYKNKIEIVENKYILYKNERKTLSELIDMADVILQKDNICCFKELTDFDIKNFY